MPMILPFETSTILIVDDEDINVALLRQALASDGYTDIHSTTDPRKVTELFATIHPKLILLDIRMPHMDGFEVMKQLEQIKGDAYLPILILTAESSHETRLSALGKGGKDFMGKPINVSELLLRVRNLLEIKLLHDQARDQNARLEEAVDARTRELLKVNEELASFNFTASHDFQEPLRKIITFGDRLQIEASDSLSDKAKHYIERMQVSALRLRALIDGLLKYSLLDHNEPDFKPLDLSQLIMEVIEDLKTSIKKSNAKINIGALPSIEADGAQMRQLFQNLVDNSIKYCKADQSPVISIDSLDTGDGVWAITIADNGIGFDEKYARQILQPFKRLHEKNKYEGTGMGLFICQKIVSRHQGAIAIASQPGKGSTFTITLPDTQKAKHNP